MFSITAGARRQRAEAAWAVGRQDAGARLLAAAGQMFLAERQRWSLWLPVGFGAGIALYFALPAEPAGWTGGLLAGVAAVGAGLCRHRLPWLLVWLAGLSVAAGFAVAQARSWLVAAPVLQHSHRGHVEGVVGDVELLPAALRLSVENPVIEGLASAATPKRVRIRLSGRSATGCGCARCCARRRRPRPPVATISSGPPGSGSWVLSAMPSANRPIALPPTAPAGWNCGSARCARRFQHPSAGVWTGPKVRSRQHC